jgi:hypothetical protein
VARLEEMDIYDGGSVSGDNHRTNRLSRESIACRKCLGYGRVLLGRSWHRVGRGSTMRIAMAMR